MPMLVLLIFVSCFSYLYCLQAEGEEGLVGVVAIYRHGDRTPIRTYPNDPYSNPSYWPVDFGQLTNIGKMQQFELGKWFRNRYTHFISNQYSRKDVFIYSTDVDRTLMSAQANLAGLFPPVGNEIWNENLQWQPIPVHTIPETEDNIVRMKKPCAKFDILYDKLLKTKTFTDIDRMNHKLYKYLSKYSGSNIKNINGVGKLYSILNIEQRYNLTLPIWTNSVFPDQMAHWAQFSFAMKCYTPELARLRVGPLLNDIYLNFLEVISGKGFKFVSYSAHDSTIANVLMALNIFDYHTPPYASTILFELRYLKNKYFVNIVYKNSSIPQQLHLEGCDYFCSLDKFYRILKPLLITPSEWEHECTVLNTYDIWPYVLVGGMVLITCSTAIIFVCACIFTLCIKDRFHRQRDYTLIRGY